MTTIEAFGHQQGLGINAINVWSTVDQGGLLDDPCIGIGANASTYSMSTASDPLMDLLPTAGVLVGPPLDDTHGRLL